jgi:hypothetical protein
MAVKMISPFAAVYRAEPIEELAGRLTVTLYA